MDTTPMLFDLDGTLVDSLADIHASVDHVRACFELPPLPRERVRAMVGDGVQRLLERALAELANPPAFEAAYPLWVAHHAEQCTVHVRPYPGVREHLARWRGDGRALAVVTNKPERFARRILAHLDLETLLPVVIGGDTIAQRKPSPAPLLAALDALGIRRRAGLMVGDGVQDLRAGKAAGMRTAAVLFGFRDAAVLRAEGADEYWTAFGVVEPA